MKQVGFSDNLLYDKDAVQYQKQVQTSPFMYMTDEIYHHSPSTCQPYGGLAPRGQKQCIGNPQGCEVGHQQRLIDLDSKLSMRNTILSKSAQGGFNDFDVNSVTPMKDLNRCTQQINPISTRMTMPASMLRGYAQNLFIDPLIDMQRHIYWNEARDTIQEAKDNFKPKQRLNMQHFQDKAYKQMKREQPSFNYNVNNCSGLLC